MKKKIVFRSVTDIIQSENNTELGRITSTMKETSYWTNIFEKVLYNLPNADSIKLTKAILRINAVQRNDNTKPTSDLTLVVRLDSASAASRFRMYAPKILTLLNARGYQVSSLEPSVGFQKKI